MALKDFVANLWEKTAAPKIESSAIELADLLYFDKTLKENVYAHLLKKYGNEVYYHDFDSYITTSNVIDLLIRSIRGESSVQPRTERQFKVQNSRRFLDYNPQYKRNKVIASRIPLIFSEIYHIVSSSLLALNTHSDLGKIQTTIAIASENIMDAQAGLRTKVDQILKTVQSSHVLLSGGGISDIATDGMGGGSEEITDITQRIKEIEKKYQNNHQFSEALSQYYGLLQSVATTLVGQSKDEADTLICTLYCNIALCQSNLGFSKKAIESLEAIPKDAALKNKVYHFVFALVYVQQNDIEHYYFALEHVEAALKIDSNYHKAFTVKQYLLVHLYPEKFPIILEELDTHYRCIVSDDKEHNELAEYYQFRGLIQLQADMYSSAIDDFRNAEKYGYDSAITKLNIAVTMYAEASRSIPKGERLLAPPINQGIMMNAVEILEEVIDMLSGNEDHDDVRKRAITLYVSACAALGKHHNLSPVAEYIYDGQEYEELRSILLGTSETLTDSQLLLLAPEDRYYITAKNMMSNGDGEACKRFIVGLINDGLDSISTPIFCILLQVCLITKSAEDYWKYRNSADKYDLPDDWLESMDACAYELEGNLSRSNEIFDKLSTSSVDDNVLENTLRYYFRNNNTEAIKQLCLRIHDLLTSGSMYTENADSFYGEATRFFVRERDITIEKVLSEIPNQFVSSVCKLQLKATYYSAINDSGELLHCLNELSCATGEFPNAFNTALCATRLLRYEEALGICYELETRTVDKDERIKLLWLISDILLLQNNLDDSFLWAKKAHELTITNPYDLSHQAFFARAFRCGHDEALKDIIEYKEEHPVVVNWFHQFSIPEDDDVVSCIENALEEFSPGHSNYVEHERRILKLYKQGLVPINMLLKLYNGELWRLFNFAAENKLHIALGNYKILMDNCKMIGDSIVVDALTLVIIANHKSLPILDGFSHVHINYRSIATVQQMYINDPHEYLLDILEWFQCAENICFEPDGFIDEDDRITGLFSADFVACCNIASTYGIPYLYCDLTAFNLQQITNMGVSEKVEFVSITAACYKVFALNQDKLHDSLYRFLKDSTFINFNAETVLYQIREQGYCVSAELMSPFMFCTTSCDMHSFANVYLSAIEVLRDEQRDAAVALAEIVFSDAHKIWNRGTYYRFLAESGTDLEAYRKATEIRKYVEEILRGIVKIFGVLPDKLIRQYEVLTGELSKSDV